jgi:hypothetical protein
MIRRTRTRRGATLVEMMVAAAMSIMIMWLLTWCYQQGLASFSNTKAHADLMDQERMVTSVLNRDLLADHFLTEDGKPNGGRMVRDQRLDLTSPTYTVPKNGFFYAYSLGTSINTVNEGVDTDGFQSTRSNDHILQFTVILPGGPPEQMFNADVPFGTTGPTYGRAAEISYFLVPTVKTLGGTQLNNLIRRQRLCALTTDDKPNYDATLSINSPPPLYPIQPADAAEVMAVSPATGTNPSSVPKIFTLNDLTNPANRLSIPLNPAFPNRLASTIVTNRIGEDILMSNVISFEVKFTGTPGAGITWPTAFSAGNSDFPYDNLPAVSGGLFDTTGTNSAKIRVTGVMIRLRAYEPRTRTTRQTTITVNL